MNFPFSFARLSLIIRCGCMLNQTSKFRSGWNQWRQYRRNRIPVAVSMYGAIQPSRIFLTGTDYLLPPSGLVVSRVSQLPGIRFLRSDLSKFNNTIKQLIN